MDLIDNKYEAIDESSEENGEENVSLILEESEFIGCDADDEATAEEGLHYQYEPKIFSSDRTGETVAYQLLQIDEGDSREMELGVPNSVKQPMQLLASPVNGQYYVISNESDPFATQTLKSFTPRVSQLHVNNKSSNSSGEPIPKKRDDKRRETHNEVERRRRDKINTWITVLGKLLPEYKVSASDVGDSKQNFESQSKGGILSRACDYILELKETNKTLDRCSEENKELMQELKNLRQLVSHLKKQNSHLKMQISDGT